MPHILFTAPTADIAQKAERIIQRRRLDIPVITADDQSAHDAVLAFPALLPLLPEELPQAPSILTIMLPNSASESTFLRFFVFINYYPFLFMYVFIPCHSHCYIAIIRENTLPETDLCQLLTYLVGSYHKDKTYKTLNKSYGSCISKLTSLQTYSNHVGIKSVRKLHISRCSKQIYLFKA